MSVKEGHIFTNSEISKGYVNYLKEQVSRIGAFDKLVHHITSPGGDVYEGYDAYHFLRGLGKPIQTVVEGQCQSIATFVALAGDEIIMLNPSRWMIHEASIPPMGIGGNADTLERSVTELRKINAEMAERYAFKTKQDINSVVQLMKKETPLSAHEAKQIGFADQVVDSLGDMKKYQQLKAVALGQNMEDKNAMEKFFAGLEEKFEAFFKKAAPNAAANPLALDLAAADGKMVNVQSENGDLVGKPVKVDGQPAPDGTIPLADGRELVVAAGLVKEVKEPMTPEQKEIQQLKSQLAERDQTLQALQAAKTESETQVQTLTTQMKDIQTQVVALKKITIGNQAPAAKGKIQDPTPSPGDNWDDDARKELFAETGINNWLNLKQN